MYVISPAGACYDRGVPLERGPELARAICAASGETDDRPQVWQTTADRVRAGQTVTREDHVATIDDLAELEAFRQCVAEAGRTRVVAIVRSRRELQEEVGASVRLRAMRKAAESRDVRVDAFKDFRGSLTRTDRL